MAATKASIPPVNLKDRIAALQQRNAGSSKADSKHAAAHSNPPRVTGSLRDKIASFEKQGAVPVPRGSFGLGAPPVDDGSSRRRGEMIGNRVPGLSKPIAPVPVNPPRVASPESPAGRKRCVSTSDLGASSSLLRSPSPTLSVDEGSSSPDPFGGSMSLGTTSPRYASMSKTQASRRSVSDVIPRLEALQMVGESLPEDEEEPEASAPAIVVSLESEQPVVQETVLADTNESDGSLHSITGLDQPSTIDLAHEAIQEHTSGDLSPSLPKPSLIATSEPTTSSDNQVPELISESTRSIGSVPVQGEANVATFVEESAHELDKPTTSTAQSVASDEAQGTYECNIQVPWNANPVPVAVGEADDMMGDSSAEGDVVSMTDRTSASSSKVSTPSDAIFPNSNRASSVKSGLGHSFVDGIEVPVALNAEMITAPPEVLIFGSSPVTLRAALGLPTQRTPTDAEDLDDLADQSLALDTSEAVIVTEPARIVSPIVTRAVLVPVPHGLSPVSPPSASTPPPIRPASPLSTASAYVEPSLTPKTTTGSFRAVVHRKVREGSTSQSHSPASSQAEALPRFKMTTVEPPQSPGFNDLADLLVDAALLEQQLSGLGSPSPNLMPKPSVTVVPPSNPPPEHRSHERPTPSIALIAPPQNPSPIAEIPESADDHSSSQYESPHEFPSTPVESHSPEPVTPPTKERVRSRIVSDTPPPVPPKSPRPRYFSTLLSRKPSTNGMLSMPGAYPRNSVCSEMSEDDSVLVSTPPSPRFDSFGSDSSSVRSSSRSWKMPKRSLSRATSFADRLWHKKGNRNTVVIASPDDDAHLSAGDVQRRSPSPQPTVPKLNLDSSLRPQDDSQSSERPTSWVSISSVGSGALDSALFDAFPSVPDSVPTLPSFSLPPDTSSYLSPTGHLASQKSGSRSSTARSGHL